MTFRDIIVDATPRDDLVQFLEYARDLAAGFDARLKAVCFAWPRTSALRTALASNPLSVLEDTRNMDAALAAAQDAFLQVFGSGSKTAEWISGGGAPALPLRCASFMRHPQERPVACTVSAIEEGRLRVRFDEPQYAPTPGQSVVFFLHDAVLGGGVMMA